MANIPGTLCDLWSHKYKLSKFEKHCGRRLPAEAPNRLVSLPHVERRHRYLSEVTMSMHELDLTFLPIQNMLGRSIRSRARASLTSITQRFFFSFSTQDSQFGDCYSEYQLLTLLSPLGVSLLLRRAISAYVVALQNCTQASLSVEFRGNVTESIDGCITNIP